MAFRTQKISQMTPKGSDLEATDLIEVSTIESGSYVTRSITGQELIDAIPVPPSGITIGTTAITSGTVGRVLFQGTGNVVQESANLFWDATNNRLGIGTSSPISDLAIIKNVGSLGSVFSTMQNTNSNGEAAMVLRNDLYYAGFELFGSTFGMGLSNTALFTTQSGITNLGFATLGAANISFRTNSTGSTNERLTIFGSSGNIGINTTTDAGFKLDVNGTARVSGNLTLGAEIFGTTNTYFNGPTVNTGTLRLRFGSVFSNGAFTVDGPVQGTNVIASGTNNQLSSTGSGVQGVLISNTATSANWRIEGHRTTSGALEFKNDITNPVLNLFSTRNVGIGTFTDAGFKLDVNGTARFKDSGSNSSVIIDYATGGYIRVNDASLGEAIRLRAGGGASWFNTGQNLLIGTTTDAGFRLDVNGTARVSNNGAVNVATFTGSDGSTIIDRYGNFYSQGLNATSGINGTGVVGLRINKTDGNGKDWRFEQNRNLTDGSLELGVSPWTNNIMTLRSTGVIGINTNAPNASAQLEVASTTRGFLPPRMTTTQKNAIASPATGLMVYDTTLNVITYYNGTTWI